MAHGTMRTFGYPDTLVREYDHWTVQLRPKQATLGALAMICKSEVTAFSDIGAEAFAEMPRVIGDIETVLSQLFGYEKINYLMLMMVDPEVHFHVLPRYAAAQDFEGVSFADPGWPGPPDLTHAAEAGQVVQARLLERLRATWPG